MTLNSDEANRNRKYGPNEWLRHRCHVHGYTQCFPISDELFNFFKTRHAFFVTRLCAIRWYANSINYHRTLLWICGENKTKYRQRVFVGRENDAHRTNFHVINCFVSASMHRKSVTMIKVLWQTYFRINIARCSSRNIHSWNAILDVYNTSNGGELTHLHLVKLMLELQIIRPGCKVYGRKSKSILQMLSFVHIVLTVKWALENVSFH